MNSFIITVNSIILANNLTNMFSLSPPMVPPLLFLPEKYLDDIGLFRYLLRLEHHAVLAGYTDYCLEIFRMLLELLHQWAHLDGLWPGSED